MGVRTPRTDLSVFCEQQLRRIRFSGTPVPPSPPKPTRRMRPMGETQLGSSVLFRRYRLARHRQILAGWDA